MKKFFLNLQFLFKPSYWIMKESYSKEIDLLMNELLDKFEFTEIGDYIAKLGETEIWIANQPYSCMMPWTIDRQNCNVRASRLTIQKGLKKLKKEIIIRELSDEIKEIRKANGLIY